MRSSPAPTGTACTGRSCPVVASHAAFHRCPKMSGRCDAGARPARRRKKTCVCLEHRLRRDRGVRACNRVHRSSCDRYEGVTRPWRSRSLRGTVTARRCTRPSTWLDARRSAFCGRGVRGFLEPLSAWRRQATRGLTRDRQDRVWYASACPIYRSSAAPTKRLTYELHHGFEIRPRHEPAARLADCRAPRRRRGRLYLDFRVNCAERRWVLDAHSPIWRGIEYANTRGFELFVAA